MSHTKFINESCKLPGKPQHFMRARTSWVYITGWTSEIPCKPNEATQKYPLIKSNSKPSLTHGYETAWRTSSCWRKYNKHQTPTHPDPPCSLLSICSHLFSTPFRKGWEWIILGLLLLGGIFPITPSAQGKIFWPRFALPWHRDSKYPPMYCSGCQALQRPRAPAKGSENVLGWPSYAPQPGIKKERSPCPPCELHSAITLPTVIFTLLLKYFFGYLTRLLIPL